MNIYVSSIGIMQSLIVPNKTKTKIRQNAITRTCRYMETFLYQIMPLSTESTKGLFSAIIITS